MLKLALGVFEKQKSILAVYESRAKFHYDFIPHNVQPDGSIMLSCITSAMQVVIKSFNETPSLQIGIKCTQCSVRTKKNIIAPLLYPADLERGELDITNLPNMCMSTRCRTINCKGQRETSIIQLG